MTSSTKQKWRRQLHHVTHVKNETSHKIKVVVIRQLSAKYEALDKLEDDTKVFLDSPLSSERLSAFEKRERKRSIYQIQPEGCLASEAESTTPGSSPINSSGHSSAPMAHEGRRSVLLPAAVVQKAASALIGPAAQAAGVPDWVDLGFNIKRQHAALLAANWRDLTVGTEAYRTATEDHSGPRPRPILFLGQVFYHRLQQYLPNLAALFNNRDSGGVSSSSSTKNIKVRRTDELPPLDLGDAIRSTPQPHTARRLSLVVGAGAPAAGQPLPGHQQARALTAMVGQLVDVVLSPERLVGLLEGLGHRHRTYGVTEVGQYGAFGAALLDALEACTGPGRWRPAVAEAWQMLFSLTLVAMVPQLGP